MAIKWTEQDVIKAMNEALTPPENGTKGANVLQQLLLKVREQKQPTKIPLGK